MKQQQFEQAHHETWDALQGWLAHEPTLDIQDVPAAYRRLCEHLAVARERHYSLFLLEHLQRLALELHQRLYGVRDNVGRRLYRAALLDYPRLVRREWRLVLAAALLFGVPLLASFLVVRASPDRVYLVLSPNEAARLVRMYTPAPEGVLASLGASRNVIMFGFYVFNNISLVFQCFASGLLAGIGSVFYLINNGLNIGTVMAHMANCGLTATFYGFVSGHSSFELTGAVVSGAAGLRMGLGLLRPGRLSRLEAVKQGARTGADLVLGAALLTLAAAAIEGFWSAGHVLPWRAKAGIGVALWGLLLGWLSLAGRRRG